MLPHKQVKRAPPTASIRSKLSLGELVALSVHALNVVLEQCRRVSAVSSSPWAAQIPIASTTASSSVRVKNGFRPRGRRVPPFVTTVRAVMHAKQTGDGQHQLGSQVFTRKRRKSSQARADRFTGGGTLPGDDACPPPCWEKPPTAAPHQVLRKFQLHGRLRHG